MSQSVMYVLKKTNAGKIKAVLFKKNMLTMAIYLHLYDLILPSFPTEDHLIPLVSPTSYPQDDLSDGEQRCAWIINIAERFPPQ